MDMNPGVLYKWAFAGIVVAGIATGLGIGWLADTKDCPASVRDSYVE